MGDAIIVRGVSKRFRRYHPNRPWTFQEALLRGITLMQPTEYFWVVRNLCLRVPAGGVVGIIGRNGVGKSTLLRLIAGITTPDEGSVQVQGRLGALLDLGAGFHPDLTGRENVFITGIISGLTRHEVIRQFDAIVDFSELYDYIDNPLRTYSTGMQMRLAFSIAIHAKPDVLLIDEVLAVGDYTFEAKCREWINRFKAAGRTILIASHDLESMRELCDEVLWLRPGEHVERGTADEVIRKYLEESLV